jgi:anti-sigma factor RsiW
VTGPLGDHAGPVDHDGLATYLLGAMSGLDAEGAEEHLARCPACARELEHLVWISELLAEAAAAFDGRGLAAPRSAGRVRARMRAGRVHPVRCH